MSVIIKIKDQDYFSFEEFAKNIYMYPDESYKLINSRKFLLMLKKENEAMYNSIIELRKSETQEGAFIFKVQYVFCPLMELKYYKGKYFTPEELGKRILNGAPRIDIYIQELIKYKLISYYMKLQGLDELEPGFYKKIIDLEESFSYNEIRTYFKMGFILSKSKEIVYRRRKYSDVKAFFDVILSPAIITSFASDFEKDQYLFAWLEILGYEKELIKFDAIISSVEEWEEK